MTMIRALPDEYQSFVSSPVLSPSLDFKTVKVAFRNEELIRQVSQTSVSPVAAANFTKSSQKRQKGNNSSTPAAPQLHCDFCGMNNHEMVKCRRFLASKDNVRAEVQARHTQQRSKNGSSSNSNSNTSASQSTAKASTEAASLTQDSDDVEEFAGNASTPSSTSLSPLYSLSLHWCADTGATSHMTPHRSWFETYEPHSVPIRVANGTVVYSAGVGSVRFRPRLNGVESREVIFNRVLHVPQLQNNLLSVLYLTSKQRFKVIVQGHSMRFERDGALLFTAKLHGQLAYLDGNTIRPHAALSAASASLLPLTLDLWHRRLVLNVALSGTM